MPGAVQEVSSLILSLNAYVKPPDGDAPEKADSVDLRGGTDESFDRGIRSPVESSMADGKSLVAPAIFRSAAGSIQVLEPVGCAARHRDQVERKSSLPRK